jgi:N-methylhydantoinase A
MRSVIIPPHSAAFSAWGVVMADRVRRYARTVSWNLHDAGQVDAVNAVAHSLIAQAMEDTRAASLDPAQLSIRRVGAFRFLGQVWEIDLDLEDRELEPADAARLHARFVERYEEIYGVGTAWRGSPVILLDYEIIATIEGSQRPFHDWQIGDTNPVCRGRRSVFDPTAQTWQEIPVFDDAAIGRGAEIYGPAIIDGKDTTIFIPEAFVAERRELGELQLTRPAQAQC